MGRDLLQIRVSTGEKAAFNAAADAGGLTLSAWARMKLRLAAIIEAPDAAEGLKPRKGRLGGLMSEQNVQRETSPKAIAADEVPAGGYICGGCGCHVANTARCEICGRKDTIFPDPRERRPEIGEIKPGAEAALTPEEQDRVVFGPAVSVGLVGPFDNGPAENPGLVIDDEPVPARRDVVEE